MNKFDEKSCGVVIFRDEDDQRFFLILKYPSGHIDLVKGHVELNETELETATRELIEETGISDVEYVDGFRNEISYRYIKNNEPSNKQVIFFLGRTKLKDVKISHEHHDFYWLPYDEALEKLTFDNAKNLLKKAKEFLNK